MQRYLSFWLARWAAHKGDTDMQQHLYDAACDAGDSGEEVLLLMAEQSMLGTVRTALRAHPSVPVRNTAWQNGPATEDEVLAAARAERHPTVKATLIGLPALPDEALRLLTTTMTRTIARAVLARARERWAVPQDVLREALVVAATSSVSAVQKSVAEHVVAEDQVLWAMTEERLGWTLRLHAADAALERGLDADSEQVTAATLRAYAASGAPNTYFPAVYESYFSTAPGQVKEALLAVFTVLAASNVAYESVRDSLAAALNPAASTPEELIAYLDSTRWETGGAGSQVLDLWDRLPEKSGRGAARVLLAAFQRRIDGRLSSGISHVSRATWLSGTPPRPRSSRRTLTHRRTRRRSSPAGWPHTQGTTWGWRRR